MKKLPNVLIAKSALIILQNASELIQESEILLKSNHCSRSYFLAQIAVEEMGKVSMLIASVQYPEEYEGFWKLFGQLFRSHSFKIGKAEITNQNHNNNFQVNVDSGEIFKTADKENQIKMSALYTDVGDGGISSPQTQISQDYAAAKLDEAKRKFEIFKNRQDRGFHDETTLNEIERFYKDPVIREIQDKVFVYRTISPREYLRLIFERAESIESNELAEVFKQLASYIQL